MIHLFAMIVWNQLTMPITEVQSLVQLENGRATKENCIVQLEEEEKDGNFRYFVIACKNTISRS